MNKKRDLGLLIALLLSIFCQTQIWAQDLSNIGGDLTSDLIGKNAIQVGAPNIATSERRALQGSGFGVFHGKFTKSTGLGPNFINSSCGGCHLNNGRGPIGSFTAGRRTTMVIKVSRPRLNADGSPRKIPGVGDQLLNQSIGLRENIINIRLRWTLVNGTYPDGTTYQLRKPRLKFFIDGKVPRRIVHSLRMSPPVIGVGLLEAIPDSTILGLSDPFDLDQNGISGKINYVPDVRKGEKAIGRFGFKATHTTVEQQSAAAFFGDMRINNSLFSRKGIAEISDDVLFRLAIYQRIGGVPRARNQNQAYCENLEQDCLAQDQLPATCTSIYNDCLVKNQRVAFGKEHFKTAGCDNCHTMSVTTGDHEDPELVNQEAHPFTDLLLHDMGPELADARSEFDAVGSEWRTSPLWGLGYYQEISPTLRYPVFLHDGRARSIEEAVLWHGGEAAPAKHLFKNFTKAEREDLLLFLNSL